MIRRILSMGTKLRVAVTAAARCLLLPVLLVAALWLTWGTMVNTADGVPVRPASGAKSRHLFGEAASLSIARLADQTRASASSLVASRTSEDVTSWPASMGPLIGSGEFAAKSRHLLGEALSAQTVITSQPSTCMAIDGGGSTVQVATSKMLFIWEGTPGAAYLTLTSCGVKLNKFHSVYVNGQKVTQVDDDPFTSACICASDGFTGQGGQTVTYPISDPGVIVKGWNYVSVTNDADLSDDWVAYNAKLVLQGAVEHSVIDQFSFSSSHDGSSRLARYQVPAGYDPAVPVPLLVSVAGTKEDQRWEDLYRFAIEANQRGWLLVSPNLRNLFDPAGGRTASLPNQHDLMDAVEYMKAHYAVDTRRIYMSGFSAGGGIAATVAAKYPHVFAAVVDWAGPSDLGEWTRMESSLISLDFGCPKVGGPSPCPVEWQRRSSRSMTENLRHVPMAIVHGRADTAVPFEQSEKLYLQMSKYYDPVAHNKLALWHDGGHADYLPSFNGLEWMSQFTLQRNPQDIMIRADENKDYYWISIQQRAWLGKFREGWSAVIASYDLNTRIISATVEDQRVVENGTLPVDVSFDLGYMGFDPGARYTIEDYDVTTGGYVLRQDVPAAGGRLTLSVERDEAGGVHHQYLIYPFAAPELIELKLQQGVSPSPGYNGVRDTYIYAYEPNHNYGAESTLAINYGRSMRSLIQFDLSQLPPQAVIKKAYLTLFLKSVSGGTSINVGIYPLLARWVDTQATWNLAANGQPWAATGAQGVGVDYSGTPVDQKTVYPNAFCSFNVKPLAERWLSGALSNEGLLLLGPDAGSGSIRYHFSSSQDSTVAQRPVLSISYMAPLQTPSPTPTTTPVACTMQGRVTLQSRPSPPDPSWAVALTVTIGSTSHRIATDQWGQFTLSGLTPGTYDMYVKHSQALGNLKRSVTLLPGSANEVDFGTLLAGDANNDNCVDIRDFYVLKETFNTSDERADFNGDGIINIYDYYPIKWNFSLCGAVALDAQADS